MRLGPLLALLLVSACATSQRRSAGPGVPPEVPHVPDFASRPYEPFSRAAAVAIALREWRLFGQPVDDDPPETRPPALPEDKPERQQGLWQRVGEYWYLGQDADRPEGRWTGLHDGDGSVFPTYEDSDYAWSAAFISYVMRSAGATTRFPYSPAHHTYIDLARTGGGAWVVSAQAPESYPPSVGDLICMSRTRQPLRYADLPAGVYPAHCAIVVGGTHSLLSVVGGNVDDAVTMTHVPTTAAGLQTQPDGSAVDRRYPWFVVLRVAYDR